MNKYLKIFLHRGLVFAGFGPIVMAIIYIVLQNTLPDFSVSGTEACMAIVSTYLLAFLQAGGSVFNQIEHWSPAKSIGCHFGLLYTAYVLCYLLNTWLPFDAVVLAIFTAVFVGVYAVVWLTVWLIVKATGKRLNRMIRR